MEGKLSRAQKHNKQKKFVQIEHQVAKIWLKQFRGPPRAPRGSKNLREIFFVILGPHAFQKHPYLNLSNKSQPA